MKVISEPKELDERGEDEQQERRQYFDYWNEIEESLLVLLRIVPEQS